MATPTICPICSAPSILTKDEVEDFTYRAGGREYPVHALIPVHTCTACGESFMSEVGESARHRAICAALNRLTPEDILALRRRLDLSRKAFGELSGIGEASLARWESGELIQSESNDNLLRLLLIDENVKFLAAVRGLSPDTIASAEPTANSRMAEITRSRLHSTQREPATNEIDLNRFPALRPADEVRLAREKRHFKLRRASGG